MKIIHTLSTTKMKRNNFQKFIQAMIKPLVFAGLLCASALHAENDKTIKSKPDKVVIYLQGAQVYRNTQVNLVAGQNNIIFEGLESGINQQSVQAGGNGNFIITDVQYITHYPELERIKNTGDAKYLKLIKQLNDSITLMEYELEDLHNKKDVLNTEKSVLMNYRLYKGEAKKDSLAFLKDGLGFLREKLNNIYAELLKIKKEENKVNDKMERINERLTEINNDLGTRNNVPVVDNKPDYRVIVSVVCEAAVSATVNINYYLANAGWTPIYDLRTEGVESPVKLTYKALVHQGSGIDWKEVKLTLSTGNPNQNFIVPELNTWYLNAQSHTYRDDKRKKSSEGYYNNQPTSIASYDGAAGAKEIVVTQDKEAEYAYNYVNIDDNVVQAEFEIKLPYTIPADNKNHIVAVLNKELETKYIYKTIPKLDLNAYLTARVTGWEDMNLLSGQANVFFDGTYVGQTSINTSTVGDTLELSMGQDKSVAIKRSKLKDRIKEKVLDNDKVYTYAYEIVVKNGNPKGIEIEVIDQLPLSSNKQIVIEKESINGASYNENTGKLIWRNNIKSKDSKKFAFSYTVKAPKDLPLAIR